MIPSTKATATIFVKTTCINLCAAQRSEEHTSELQSRLHLVCRLLLEKKNKHEDTCASFRRRSRRELPAPQSLGRSPPLLAADDQDAAGTDRVTDLYRNELSYVAQVKD